jgi:hypothetical protein
LICAGECNRAARQGAAPQWAAFLFLGFAHFKKPALWTRRSNDLTSFTRAKLVDMVIAHLLGRTIRVEADLVDQLFNSPHFRVASRGQ